MTRPRLRWLAVTALCAACAGSQTVASPSDSPTPTSTTTTALAIETTEARYGVLAIHTTAGAQCSAEIDVSAADFGESPPTTLSSATAPASGVVRWTYAAPRVPTHTGSYAVVCRANEGAGSAKGSFDIAPAPLSPAALSVRVTTDTPRRPDYTPDGTLVTLRDAAAARMNATLATEWKAATRGLGDLRVVADSADITIYVVAAKGTSVHRTSLRDHSEDIVIFVNDARLGVENVDNLVATSLHELGHIWCCSGPEADDGGHWREKLRDPGLYGVDRYGLMTEPVTCVQFGAIVSCPNRFSDREMRALGFATFPAPVLDACTREGLSLRSQIASGRAQIADVDAKLKAIVAQYGTTLPPAIYAQYTTYASQYDALIRQVNGEIDRINALPCDSS